MKKINKQIEKVSELNTLFLSLNEENQFYALSVIKALEFAQTVMKNPSVEELKENT